MSLTKGQTLLYLYNKLEKERSLIKADAMELAGLTDITFKRYIAEIRSYLLNFEPGTEIKYIRKRDIYVLTKTTR